MDSVGKANGARAPRSGLRAWGAALLVSGLVFFSGVAATPRGLGERPGAAAPGVSLTRSSVPATSAPAPASAGIRKNPDIEVDPNLMRQLSSGGSRDFAIEFEERPDLTPAYSMDWQSRGRFVHSQLTRAAERSQAGVSELLRRRGERFQRFTTKNVILVRGGSYQTLSSLLSFEEIKRIRIPPRMGLILPERFAAPDPRTQKASAKSLKVFGSNISWVEADDVWATGITGDGTVIGVIDSGVRYDHEALVTQYRGNLGAGFDHDFNWFDPEGGSLFPAPASSALDDQHGTHVAGTIVGDDFDPNEANRDRVGMAPGAKWIACQGFPAGGSVDAALLACGDFMLAPTDLGGNNANPDLRPMAVNNSWGACTAGAVDDYYRDVVDAWHAAGVIPVFASGNASNCGYSSPPGLATVGSPGAYPDVFTIGSTGNANGLYAPHSNWGPTEGINLGLPNFPDPAGFPRLKPNVVAPGVNIRSTIGTGTNTYDSAGWSGTSMSTPHVVGLMALMFQAAPCLVGDFGTTGTLIQQTARPIDYASGTSGGAEPPGVGNVPNYATGWGEIDAPEAVNAAIEACGPQGTLTGVVTEDGTGSPIADALVEIFIDENVRIYSTTTDAAGQYSRRVPATAGADTYTVRVSRYGYLGESVGGLTVAEEGTTTQDFALQAADVFTVSGVVRDSATLWPLHARLQIAGFPGGPVWSDPLTGAYSVQLAEGIEYSFTVTASVPGYLAGSASVGPLAANLTQDFALVADGVACNAPGYALGAPLLSEDFQLDNGPTTPPAGWTIATLGTGTTPGWRFGTAQGSSFFPIPPHTRYAAANDDDTSNTNASADYLTSPVIDLSGVASPVLRFESRLSGEFGSVGRVLGSTDGGATWTAVIGNAPANGRTGPWTTQTMNLGALAGSNQARLRFHHDDSGQYATGWGVDDVIVSPGCLAPATGGLVTGRVLDDNTGDGLVGAIVTVDGGASALSIANADPAVGNGYYAVYAAPGSVDLDASAGPALPAGYATASATVTVADEQNTALDLELPAPRLTVDPAGGPSATLALGQTQTLPFQIVNDGAAATDYAIVSAGVDEDFEAGVPPAGWTQVDAGSGCPWNTNVAYGMPNYAGADGLSATVSSDACGDGTTADASLISPPFSLEFSTQASLDFVLSYRHLGGSRFDVDLSTDNGASWTNIYFRNTSTSATGPGTPVQVDLSGYLGTPQARIRLRYTSAWDWYVQVDQLRLFADANSVAWLGLSPTARSVAAGAAGSHSAVFRANQVAQPGDYVTRLRVVESTPYAPPQLDAAMQVTAPASFGTVSGTVTGLGYCDADPAPIPGATVFIQGGSQVYQTTTDANGNYSWQLDAGQAPLSISASAPGHVAASAPGIALSAGTTATANLELRAQLPCFDVVQSSLSATLQAGEGDQRPLTLANSGAAALDPWQVEVGGDPTIVSAVTLTQSVSSTVLAANAVACGGSGTTADNSFMRLYRPSLKGFTGNVTIREVRFQVESATAAAGGTQPVEAWLYAVNGALSDLDLTALGNETVQVADGNGTSYVATFDPAIVVPADTQLLVELFSDDAGNAFYPGTNDAGETAPSYIFSTTCGITTPTPYADIGFPSVHLLLDIAVEGAQVCGAAATPVTWLSATPASGSIAAGGSSTVAVGFESGSLAVGQYAGGVCIDSADPVNGMQFVPASLDVVAAVPDIDLSVAAVESADPVQAGTALDYSVTVANAGPDAAAGVELDIVLAAGLAFDGADGAGWSCTEASGTVHCTLSAPVAAAGTAAALVLHTTPLLAGPIQTTFDVSGTGEDAQAANDSVSVSTTVTPAPDVDMALNASVDPGSVTVGTNVRLRLIAANVGSDAASGVEIALTLPSDVGYVGASGSGWSCSAAGSAVVCTQSAAVPSGFAPTLDLTLSTGPSFGTLQTLAATVAASQADGNVANNQASVELTITPAGVAVFGNGFE